MTEFEFDVALSFAGEDRGYVEGVATALQAADVRIFYDEYEETALWGADLAVHLDQVYRTKAQFVVIFVSRHYAEKKWPRHEFRSALARAVEEKEPYLLPVRLDDTELPGLSPTTGYVDGTKLTPEQVAGRVRKKLRKISTPPGESLAPSGMASSSTDASASIRLPKVRPPDFNPYEEAERTIAVIRDALTARVPELRKQGLTVHATNRDGRFALKVLHNGETVYTFEVWLEGRGDSLAFHDGQGGYHSPGSMTASGAIEWDRERGAPVVKLINFSLLTYGQVIERPTAVELVAAVWNSMVEKIEQRA